MGELFQLTVAEQVGSTVANVCEPDLGAVEQGARDCRTHPVQGEISLNEIGNPVVRLVDGAREHLQHLLTSNRLVDPANRVDGNGGRKISCRSATHAVSDDEQLGTGVAGVLVVLAD